MQYNNKLFSYSLFTTLAVVLLGITGARADDSGIMRQYQMVESPEGGYEAVIRTAPIPEPAADEVLVRMRAVSLNRKDIYYYEDDLEDGSETTPGLTISDGAGDVAAIGSNVTRFKVGDRVMPGFDTRWVGGQLANYRPREGLLSEYVLVTEATLAKVPDYMTYEEAATLPCAGVTAWTSLFKEAQLKPGEFVLLEGTGGVSIFGLQLAAAAGGRPIITSSSDKKLEQAREMGAIATINYRKTPDWHHDVRAATGDVGVMHVLEVGGKDTLPKAIKSLAMGGHIALIGGLSEGGFVRQTPEELLKPYNGRLTHMYTGSRVDLENLAAFMSEHEMHPLIDRVFSFEEAIAAYQYMVDEAFMGKIVIAFD